EFDFTNRVHAGSLGTLDLTGFTNGPYRIQLFVERFGNYLQPWDGQTWSAQDNKMIMLNSQLKLGRLAFSVTDLQVPIQGVPITINRNYDSLDDALGDFGPAWQLSIGAGKLSKSQNLGIGWQE